MDSHEAERIFWLIDERENVYIICVLMFMLVGKQTINSLIRSAFWSFKPFMYNFLQILLQVLSVF